MALIICLPSKISRDSRSQSAVPSTLSSLLLNTSGPTISSKLNVCPQFRYGRESLVTWSSKHKIRSESLSMKITKKDLRGSLLVPFSKTTKSLVLLFSPTLPPAFLVACILLLSNKFVVLYWTTNSLFIFPKQTINFNLLLMRLLKTFQVAMSLMFMLCPEHKMINLT